MQRQPALKFIFVTVFLDVLGVGLIVPILPNLIRDLSGGDISNASYIHGILAASYGIMQFVFAPVLGSLSDRYGRRSILLTCQIGGGIDYFLLAFAPSLGWFFVGRIIAGITSANLATANAYIADISTGDKRAVHFGMIGAASGLGFIIGPALGGLLAEVGMHHMGSAGMRLPFIVAGVLTLVNWFYGFFVLPESLARENRRDFSIARSNPFSSLAALKKHPVVFGLSATFLLLSIANQVLPTTWVLFTTYRFDWSEAQIGASLALVGFTATAVYGGFNRILIPKLGEKRAIVVGLCINSARLVLYALAPKGWMLYLIIVGGAFGGLANPAIQSLISRNVGRDEQGSIQGSLASLTSLAAIIGPPIATGLFGYFVSDTAFIKVPGAAFFAGAIMIMAAAGLAVHSFKSIK